MAIRNNHWYNLNEQRYYPLDDTASAVSDAGELLPNALIADLRLRWPNTYGEYAFLSSAAVTPRLITVLIEVAEDLDNLSGSRLIAGVTVSRDSLIPGRAYALTPFQPGVGGFIVLGANLEQTFSGRFSTPRQGLLTPRAARPNRRPPVTTIGLERAAESLTGLVDLVAVPPLYLKREPRTIDGELRQNVIVFYLSQTADEFVQTETTESVFSQFAGPCGQRVGSKTCPDPQPLQTINGVEPDCDGVLTLDFLGCAVVGRNVADGGVVLDCNLRLRDSCAPGYLPDLATGVLPIEHPPVIIPPVVTPDPPVPPDTSISDPPVLVLSLPYCDTFSNSDTSAFPHGFSAVATTAMGYVPGISSPFESFCCNGPPPSDPDSAYGCHDVSISFGGDLILNPDPPPTPYSFGGISTRALAQTNIALWTLDVQTLYRIFSTDVKIIAPITTTVGSPPALNAGIVINYKLNTQGLPTYVLAQIDFRTNLFGIYYFNGVNLVELATSPLSAFAFAFWCRLQLSAIPSPSDSRLVQLTARVTPLMGTEESPEAITLVANLSGYSWGIDAANSGIYTRRSLAYFSYWRVEEGVL